MYWNSFYGWEFQASSLFGMSTGGTQRRYYEIEPLLKEGWIRHWNTETKTPWLSHPDQTHIISYDDQESITEKCYYILNHGLAGAIIWALGQDNIDGNPLLTVVGTELKSYIQTIQTPRFPTQQISIPTFPIPSMQKPTFVSVCKNTHL